MKLNYFLKEKVDPVKEKGQSGVSVIIPAYNEEGSVGRVIDELKAVMEEVKAPYEIIAIDDGSNDGTAAAIKMKEGVKFIQNGVNEGYGASLKSGIRQAQYATVVIIDADGTYPVGKTPELLRHADNYDMVVASRTGDDIRIPLLRKMAKFILTSLANYLSGMKIPDLNSGFRVIRKEVITEFLNILPSGFSFTTTATLALLTNKRPVKYVPINYHHRARRSKFHPLKDTMSMFTLIVRTILCFNPLKIFVPLSFAFIGAGVVVFFWSFFFLPRILDVTTLIFIMTGVQTLVIGLLADLIDRRMR